ncbi:hypothetical protein P4A64_005069 [Escherichia coli]|uniref:hypothetical protein n=2 Tax=Escherichia coli TaxID=562 RepID=UPI00112F585F|nr:hypothetical protein [Escherichia coli]EJY3858827.1 hypothetical protein [Salmonella enterica subsp. enterica serovar Infantis]EFB6329995.1 hypothetical protein [Escherichia coli]EFB6353331.1 hypothetical protein [Escherichia coli]EFE8350336.1 hypothetical protein [Escherichia coli]EHH7885558.1 hypothetical protein [Escherichia coli]
MWLKFIGCDRGSFSGGLLPFLPVCCRDRTERVSAVRATDVMVNANGSGDVKKPPERWLFHFLDRVERHLRHQLWLVAPEGGGRS